MDPMEPCYLIKDGKIGDLQFYQETLINVSSVDLLTIFRFTTDSITTLQN